MLNWKIHVPTQISACIGEKKFVLLEIPRNIRCLHLKCIYVCVVNFRDFSSGRKAKVGSEKGMFIVSILSVAQDMYFPKRRTHKYFLKSQVFESGQKSFFRY